MGNFHLLTMMSTNSNFPNFADFLAAGIKLDMSRGKPSPEQLDLSNELMTGMGAGAFAADGSDCRNYGSLLGLSEAREFFARLLDVNPSQMVVAGNSSLALMHDAMVFALLHGFAEGAAWSRQRPVRFLCPVPGYDRHFSICEHLGIEMLCVDMRDDGPDMDQVERLVREDQSIKGIWCMPKYSNPSGTVYSHRVAERLAGMPTAARDFRIFWDDAYRWHHLTDDKPATVNILKLCESAGFPNRALVFASTSKVTFASAGVALFAAADENVAWWQKHLSMQTIGPDKLNQLRHVRFFTKVTSVEQHMERHRDLLKPRFDAVERIFREQLGDIEGISWTTPRGGYFVDLMTPPGLASATVALAQSAGLTLTPAGASYPYRRDPSDQHIRIAPSFPSIADVHSAAYGISASLKEALRKHASDQPRFGCVSL